MLLRAFLLKHLFDVVAVVVLLFVAEAAVDLQTRGLTLGGLLLQQSQKLFLAQRDQGFGGAVTTAIPGIIVQVILIPVIVWALKKAKLIDRE